MREFFELVNEYPWTTVLLCFGICFILSSLGEAIHGPKKITILKTDKEEEDGE